MIHIEQKLSLRTLSYKFIDLILPPRCVVSGDIVDQIGMLSPKAWASMHFIDSPFCPSCGLPFEFNFEGDILCGNCLASPPLFSKCRSALVYNDTSRSLILSFKHGDRLHMIHNFAQWLMRSGQDILTDADILIPVPLHRRRLWKRRYNQSALLAQSLSKICAIPTRTDLLLRHRVTPSQKGLTKKERYKNIHGAFHVLNKEVLKGKNIILIDDVYTSGATLNECARTLKKESQCADIRVLTLARALL